jgi:nitrogenase molybdenum-iron protein alpha chain
MTREETQALIQEVLEVYPEKAKKDRAKHLAVNDQSIEQSKKCITSNRKSQPGVMTVRGCAYAGSKGVVWGPIKDMVHISHGPVGCGQYSRAGRRNYYVGMTGMNTFGTMNFTSDFQEKDIVFGGDKKLDKIITEIETLFPLAKGVSVQSECPIGLIGDDIEAVSKKKAKELNKPVVPVRCEGFRGVSQSLGHHIANDSIRDWVIGNRDGDESFETTPYDVAVIGDYNIGGDAWASRILLEEMGLRVVAQWSGDGTLSEMELTPKVKLNLIHCYRSMNYISRHMEEKYGIPWMEYNFFGPTKIAESLRAIAARFDEKIQDNAEKVIAKYRPSTRPSSPSTVRAWKASASCSTSAVCVRATSSAPTRTWAWKWSAPATSSPTTTTTTAPSRRWATRPCCTTTSPATSSRSSSSASSPT